MPYKTRKEGLSYERLWRSKNVEKIRKYARERYKQNRQKESERKKQYWIKNRDKILKTQRKYRKENKEKIYLYFKNRNKNPEIRKRNNARSLVHYAVKRGQLLKKACFCGNTNVEGHHKDYNKPLDVIWLCRKHHIEEDKKNEKNNNLF